MAALARFKKWLCDLLQPNLDRSEGDPVPALRRVAGDLRLPGDPPTKA